MSTMEHLFMQIFERRDWISGQLRQQGESYAQSLASNLLAAGGSLPPWLWTAVAGSDVWNLPRPQASKPSFDAHPVSPPRSSSDITSYSASLPPYSNNSLALPSFDGLRNSINEAAPDEPYHAHSREKAAYFTSSKICPSVEPRQLISDGIEEWSLHGDFDTALGKEKQCISSGTNKDVTASKSRGSNDAQGSGQLGKVDTSEIKYSRRRKVDDKETNLLGSSPVLRLKSLHPDEDGNCPLKKGSGQAQGTYEPSKQFHVLKEVEVNLSFSCHKSPSELLHQSKTIDVTSCAASLPPSGNNSLASYFDGLMNCKDEDAPDGAYHGHSRPKASFFTSSEICPDVEPGQLVSVGIKECPLHGDFGTALEKEKQCVSSGTNNDVTAAKFFTSSEICPDIEPRQLVSVGIEEWSLHGDSGTALEKEKPCISSGTNDVVTGAKFSGSNVAQWSRQSGKLDVSEIRYSKRRKVDDKENNLLGSSPVLGFKSLHPDDDNCSLRKGSANAPGIYEQSKQCHVLKEVEVNLSYSCHKSPPEVLHQSRTTDIASCAATLPSSGNNSLALSCVDGTMNSKNEDAMDAANHSHSRAKTAIFTSSSEIHPDVEPGQLVSVGIMEWPLHGDFGTALGKEKQCISCGTYKDVTTSKSSACNDVQCSRQSGKLGMSENRDSKRRKVDSKENNLLSSSPVLGFKPLYSDEDDNCSLNKGSRNALETCERKDCCVLKEVEVDLPYSCHKTPSEVLPQSKTTESDSHLKSKEEDGMSSSYLQRMHEETSLDCHVGSQVDGDSTNCSMDDGEISESLGSPLDLKEPVTVEDATNLLDIPNTLISECLESTCIEEILDGTKSNDEMVYPLFLSSVAASHSGNKDLGISEETMPELEGFSIQSPIMGNGFIFDDPNLQHLTRERATTLEKLRGSMNTLTPFSCLSTKHRIHRVPDVCQSLPGELFKCMNFEDHIQSNGTDNNDIKAAKDGNLADTYLNTVANFNGTLLGRSGSHSMPSCRNQFFYNGTRAPCSPPVEKFSQKIYLERKGGALDRIGSNPELTCFRIDENAISLEENVCIDEFQDSPKERFNSREKGFLSSRKALTDVTSIYQNAPAVGSKEEKSLDHDILGFAKSEPSFPSNMNDKQSLENGCGSHVRCEVENKENKSLSMGGNKVQKVVVSLPNRGGKVSMKAGVQKRSQAILEKKANNVVSNISSFIPLVRQKQQLAAPITGKRDIKVKALEAAEAAKRVAEKREVERKMKKEAARLERMRLEQENARQLELKQKQKEEEKKKKEASIAARKRQREEERKEKQRKRNCIEGLRHRKDNEERVHAEEKELQHKAAEEKQRKGKVLAEAGGMHHKEEKGPHIAEGVKLAEVDQDCINNAGVVQNGGNSLQFCGAHKDTNVSQKVVRSSSESHHTMHDKNISLKENRQSQSYEISPYRDSDDEDGEDDKKHKKKFIPSWSRGEILHELLISQRHVDPTKIFCRKSSFDLSEVLSSRIRQRGF